MTRRSKSIHFPDFIDSNGGQQIVRHANDNLNLKTEVSEKTFSHIYFWGWDCLHNGGDKWILPEQTT